MTYPRHQYYIYLHQKESLLIEMKQYGKKNNQQRYAYYQKKLALLQFKLEYADMIATKLGMKKKVKCVKG